jgi:hypothetical protein
MMEAAIRVNLGSPSTGSGVPLQGKLSPAQRCIGALLPSCPRSFEPQHQAFPSGWSPQLWW